MWTMLLLAALLAIVCGYLALPNHLRESGEAGKGWELKSDGWFEKGQGWRSTKHCQCGGTNFHWGQLGCHKREWNWWSPLYIHHWPSILPFRYIRDPIIGQKCQKQVQSTSNVDRQTFPYREKVLPFTLVTWLGTLHLFDLCQFAM